MVLYETSADASNAISRLNGYEFHGRPLEVRLDKYFRPDTYRNRFPHPRTGARPGYTNYGVSPVKKSPFTYNVKGDGPVSDTIFVGNLPWATTDLDLHELFQSVATVVKAEIQCVADGRSAGSGVVQFDTPASAHIAVEKLNGYTYGNRSLSISFATYPSAPEPLADGVPTAPATAIAAPSEPAATFASESAN